jgi:hypothetical protein
MDHLLARILENPTRGREDGVRRTLTQEYVQARKRREIFELVGKVDYYDDYDPKRLRDRKPR